MCQRYQWVDLASFGVDDFKRLVAYSSVNHMGFVILGVAVAAYARGYGDQAFASTMAVNVFRVKPSTHCIFRTGYQSPRTRMPCSRYVKSTMNGNGVCFR